MIEVVIALICWAEAQVCYRLEADCCAKVVFGQAVWITPDNYAKSKYDDVRLAFCVKNASVSGVAQKVDDRLTESAFFDEIKRDNLAGKTECLTSPNFVAANRVFQRKSNGRANLSIGAHNIGVEALDTSGRLAGVFNIGRKFDRLDFAGLADQSLNFKPARTNISSNLFFANVSRSIDSSLRGLRGLPGLFKSQPNQNNRNERHANTESRRYGSNERPSGHIPLGAKVGLGILVLIAGVWGAVGSIITIGRRGFDGARTVWNIFLSRMLFAIFCLTAAACCLVLLASGRI